MKKGRRAHKGAGLACGGVASSIPNLSFVWCSVAMPQGTHLGRPGRSARPPSERRGGVMPGRISLLGIFKKTGFRPPTYARLVASLLTLPSPNPNTHPPTPWGPRPGNSCCRFRSLCSSTHRHNTLSQARRCRVRRNSHLLVQLESRVEESAESSRPGIIRGFPPHPEPICGLFFIPLPLMFQLLAVSS